LPQRILRNARTFVNVAQRDLGREQNDRILVAEEEILYEIQERHFQQSF
jgi:hypothetical protein